MYNLKTTNNMKIISRKLAVIPPQRTAAHALLMALLDGPGTFYQLCERARFDVEAVRDENIMRAVAESLVTLGHARLSGLTYSISPATRRVLRPPVAYAGQVAAPHYRGTCMRMPVTIVRRVPARGVRA